MLSEIKQLLKEMFTFRNLLVMIPSYMVCLMIMVCTISYFTKGEYIVTLARSYLAHNGPTVLYSFCLLSFVDKLLIFFLMPFSIAFLNAYVYKIVTDHILEIKHSIKAIKEDHSQEMSLIKKDMKSTVDSIQTDLNRSNDECDKLNGEVKQCLYKYKEQRDIRMHLEAELEKSHAENKKASLDYDKKLKYLAEDYIKLKEEIAHLKGEKIKPTNQGGLVSETFDL